MATYRMDDGTVVKTENASREWEEDTDWDGHNHVSKATGSPHHHQRLYCSRKGRYYIESTSNWQGEASSCEWVGNHTAAVWLLHNSHELPDDLKALEDEISE